MIDMGTHGRRCAVCEDPIGDNGRCARCAEDRGSRSELSPATPHSRWINEMLGYFRFSSEEAAEFSPQVIEEIERRLPEWLKSMTLMGILPLIQRRGRKFYLLMGVPFSDVDELASKLVENVLRGLSKAFPRGNVGAWIATIQRHVLMDYWRMKGRERRHLGIRQDADSLADVRDASLDEASLKALIEDLPAASREIVERRLEGAEWTEIAVHHQKTVDDLKKSVQSMIWPEGSLPLRRKRRR